MKNVFAIVLLLTGVGAFLVFWDSQPDVFLKKKPQTTQALPPADSFMVETVTRKFGDNGRETYHLTADAGRYYQDKDLFEMDNPRLLAYQQKSGAQPWRLEANSSQIFDSGEKLVLSGDVYAWQVAGSDKNELKTSQLIFFPKKNQAQTDRPVTLLAPNNRTTAVGMRADFESHTYQLLSRVRSTRHGL